MKSVRIRDSQKSREDILNAAEIEFSNKGIYGTRIDEIAARANINKRMIYEYFGNKEELYRSVLSAVYSRLSRKEFDVLSKNISCTDAIKKIILLQFEFLHDNPSYVNLILWENLNKGKYIKDLDFSQIKDPTLELLRNTIDRGKAEGVFRNDIDTRQVILSILTHTFSYYSNRYTLSKLLSMDMESNENIKQRAEIVIGMVLSYLCKKAD